MAGDPIQKAAPRALYYLTIDGTSAIDSVAYGELLEGSKHGWRNLVGDFLSPAPDDAARLLDPAHGYLPICRYSAKTPSKFVAVVCPGGREGLGMDPFWKAYPGETAAEHPHGKFETDFGTVFGRHAAHYRSATLVGELILIPTVQVVTKEGAEVRRLFDARELPDTRDDGTMIPADLLIVSSHGWLGGYMRGDSIRTWQEAEPAEARPEESFIWFVVGEMAEQARGFQGPSWIILAQCSTVNRATWPLWARVLSNSVPGVRGILAYEEVSPSAAGSIPVARSFVSNCETMTILDAWKAANRGKKWAAIVHQEAVNDRMADWRNFAPLSAVSTGADSGNYLGFLRSTPAEGEPIRDVPPPFGLRLDAVSPPTGTPTDPDVDWLPITPENLHRGRARLVADRWYRLGLVAPGEHQAVAAEVTWVHIRTSHHDQFRATALYQQLIPYPGQEDRVAVQVDPNQPRLIRLQAKDKPDFALAMVFQGQTQAGLDRTRLEGHHSYLWPRIRLQLETGDWLEHDFLTQGLSYIT